MYKALLLTIISVTLSGVANASAPACSALFNGVSIDPSKPVQKTTRSRSITPNKAIKEESDSARNKPSPWIRFYNVFDKRTKKLRNPFILAGLDPDKTGLVHAEFRKIIPVYQELIKTSEEVEVSYDTYISLSKELTPRLLAIAKNRDSLENEMFAALESARIMTLIESRTVFPKDSKEYQEKKKQEEKKKEEEKEKEQEEDDFKWNEKKQEYKPENKDISSKGKGKKPVIILRTNAHSVDHQLYRQEVFDTITPEKIIPNLAIRPRATPSSKQEKTEFFTRLGLFGSSKVLIPIQYGYEPVVGNYKDFRVVESEPDIFYVEALVEGLKEAEIPLIKKRNQQFQSSLGDRPYRDPTGIPKSDWPAEILNFVKNNEGKGDLEIAKNLESFLSKDGGYLYFSKGDIINEAKLTEMKDELKRLESQYATPIAMTMLKSFNCDGAAWIGAAILKDFFGIPTRIVGGRTSAGKERMSLELGEGGKALSVIRSTDPLHAWLEVWDGSKWIPFDMTPKLNNPEMESGKSDLEQHERKENDSENRSKPKPESSKSSQEKENVDSKNRSNLDKTDDKKEQGDKGEGSKNKERDSQNKDSDAGPRDSIESRDSEAKSKLRDQYLIYKAFEVLKSWSAEMLLMDSNRKGTKTIVSGVLKNLDITEFKQHQQDAARWFESRESDIFDRKDESLSQRISSVKIMSSEGKLREAYLELKAIEMLIRSVQENRMLTEAEETFSIAVQDSIRAFQAIKHKNSVQFDLADRILRNLPGAVSRQWVREKYGSDVDKVDSLSMMNFANDILTGNLQALVRSALLKNFVDMVLNSDKIPRYKDEKTLFRSVSPKPSQDLVLARSALEVPKMLLDPRPGEHIFSKLARGEQFAIGSRETVRTPDPKKPLERKVSILYFDISGSMGGDKMLVQDSFLMTYVDRALSDIDFFGNPLHEVYIIPFGDTVHTKNLIHIKTVEDAKRFTSKMINYNHEAHEGTEIEPVLIHFYDTIAQAHIEKGQGKKTKLHKANLVLITDGGANVNMDNVLAARAKVSKEIQINMNFLAISETNPTLIQLAESSNMSTTKPMYRHITPEMISDIMLESQKPSVDESAFAQVENARATPELVRALNQLSSKIADFKIQPKIQDIQKKISEFKVQEIDLKNLPNIDAPAELIQLQRVLVHMDLPRDVKIRLVYALLYEYEAYSRRKLDFVLIEEKEAFEALYEWARN